MIYLIEDMEFKNKFEDLSLYKVGYTARNVVDERFSELHNREHIKILWCGDGDEEDEEKLSEKVKNFVDGQEIFYSKSGNIDFAPMIQKLWGPKFINFLEKKYWLPEQMRHWRENTGGLTEYFVGKSWESNCFSTLYPNQHIPLFVGMTVFNKKQGSGTIIDRREGKIEEWEVWWDAYQEPFSKKLKKNEDLQPLIPPNLSSEEFSYWLTSTCLARYCGEPINPNPEWKNLDV
jgi:hypothetical protein